MEIFVRKRMPTALPPSFPPPSGSCQNYLPSMCIQQPAAALAAFAMRPSMPGLLFDNWKINLLKMLEMRKQRMPAHEKDYEAPGTKAKNYSLII